MKYGCLCKNPGNLGHKKIPEKTKIAEEFLICGMNASKLDPIDRTTLAEEHYSKVCLYVEILIFMCYLRVMW